MPMQFGQGMSTEGQGFATDAVVNTIPLPDSSGGISEGIQCATGKGRFRYPTAECRGRNSFSTLTTDATFAGAGATDLHLLESPVLEDMDCHSWPLLRVYRMSWPLCCLAFLQFHPNNKVPGTMVASYVDSQESLLPFADRRDFLFLCATGTSRMPHACRTLKCCAFRQALTVFRFYHRNNLTLLETCPIISPYCWPPNRLGLPYPRRLAGRP